MADQILTSPPQGRTPFALAEAIFNERRMVDELIEQHVVPVLRSRRFKTLSEKLFAELFFARVWPWLATLGRLANANDYQAVIAGDRGLFETTVDLTLMRFEPTKYPAQKMLAWEDSAKFKAFKGIVEFYAKKKVAVPKRMSPAVKFVKDNASTVDAVRRQSFRLDKKGKPQHPARWTEGNLEIDSRTAQEVTPVRLRWAIDLEEFYATRHSPMCWNVHGSGAAGVRFIEAEDIPHIGSTAMSECLDFIVRCAELTLMEFGTFNAAAKEAFETCRKRRIGMLSVVMKHHDPTFGTPPTS